MVFSHEAKFLFTVTLHHLRHYLSGARSYQKRHRLLFVSKYPKDCGNVTDNSSRSLSDRITNYLVHRNYEKLDTLCEGGWSIDHNFCVLRRSLSPPPFLPQNLAPSLISPSHGLYLTFCSQISIIWMLYFWFSHCEGETSNTYQNTWDGW